MLPVGEYFNLSICESREIECLCVIQEFRQSENCLATAPMPLILILNQEIIFKISVMQIAGKYGVRGGFITRM